VCKSLQKRNDLHTAPQFSFRSQTYTDLLVDAKPDEMTILTLQDGSTDHAKRIASIPAAKQY